VNPFQAIADWPATGSYTHGGQACQHGVPKLRPRFALVAIKPRWAAMFGRPERQSAPPLTVGAALADLQVGDAFPPPVAAALGTANAIALGQAFHRRPPKPGHATTHDFVHSGSAGDFRQDVLQRLTDYWDVG
jgi:hypothetical protein